MNRLRAVLLIAPILCLALGVARAEPRGRPVARPSSQQAIKEGPRERRVLVIGIDGVRPDALLRAKAPTLRRLAREGQVDWDAQVVDTTLSGPSWAGFLTGVGVGRHGVRNNKFDGHRLAEVKTFFERVREVYPNDHLASIVAWQPFHSVLLANRRLGANMWRKQDDSVIDLAVYQLKKRDPRVLLVHLDAVDKAGHDYGYGPGAGHYRAAIEATDVRVGRLLAGLKARQKRLAEDWLVLVTTDHGGTGHGHGGGTPTDRRIFIIARGLGEAQTPFPKGSATLFDIAPTVLAYLGVPESSWASLDGRPLQLPLPAGVRPAVAAGEAGASAPASELP